jgi:peptidoglycan/LPS O-acetylase OafA/YrhL
MVFASHLPWYQYFPHGIVRGVPSWLSPAAPLFGIGGFAVVLFLVISGAGLCRLLVLRGPSLGRFLRDRVGKLFTQYWTIAVPIVAVGFAVRWLTPSQLWNSVLVLTGLSWVSPSSFAAIFPSWWYMGIAWQVVLVMPLIVWGFRKVRPAGVLAITAAVVLASCYLVPALHLDYGEKSFIIARALEVLGGTFLAMELWPEVREKVGVSRAQAGVLVASTFGCMIVLLAGGLGGRWLYGAAGLALVALLVYARPIERAGVSFLTRAALYGGALSFTFYLLHEPIMLIVRHYTGAPGRIWLGPLAAICLVAVSLATVLFSAGTARVGKAVARRRQAADGEA